MFRSIRWTLLSWYALILLLVIGGFGGTLFYMLQRAMQKEVHGRLMGYAQTFAGALEDEGGALKIELSQEFMQYFRQNDDKLPYFAVWDGKGALVDRSPLAPEGPRPDKGGRSKRGSRYEVFKDGPHETLILVGQKIKEQKERLQELLGAVLGIGGGVMVLGLLGGWFLAGRALKPIRKMTQAATAVSASNLSQRIDVGRTESELGQLAKTLNEAFDRLEKAFERQTRFTADASHELRTPLSIIMSQAELALRRERSPEEYRESLETALKASQRMKAVVEGLLTLARADARELEIRRDRVDLGKIVEETVSLLGPLAIERKVTLTASVESVEILGDPDRLREVVTNLVTNAIRYNRDGGKVEVTLSAKPDEAVLSVADTGIGIPEKDQPHVFERFYRVDKARSREAGGPRPAEASGFGREGGNGLGLSIAKWVVEAHGGHLSFTSRENEGTTFSVRLPRPV
jgi:two-component system, OmpR family, sensor kinase